MNAAWLSLGGAAFVIVGCGGGNGTDRPANTAGTSAGGNGSSSGMTTGGSQSQNQSGAATGGSAGSNAASGSGSGGEGAGSGGARGGNAGATSKGFACPAGASPAPVLTGLTPVRVEGVPPADDFNDMNNAFTNIEGDVWLGDALYVSEINPNPTGGAQGVPPPARVLKITADDKVSIVLPDSGSNGLASNAAGELFGAIHKDGSISKLSLSGGAAVPIVSMFMSLRFNSPNDLAIHSNGTIYFSDPSFQAPSPVPQAATRAYRVPPGGQPEAIEPSVNLTNPNGVTLSKNQDFLYISGGQLKKYPVMADGSLGAGTTFVQGGGGDGMVVDCGDNLYVAAGSGPTITVYSPAGMVLGSVTVNGIDQVTNLAFGGADHKTLYVSGQGGKTGKGLFKIAMNVAGFSY